MSELSVVPLKNRDSYLTYDDLEPENPAYLVTSEGYAFYWSELQRAFDGMGAGINPYTQKKFPPADDHLTKRYERELAASGVAPVLSGDFIIQEKTLVQFEALLAKRSQFFLESSYDRDLPLWVRFFDTLSAEEQKALNESSLARFGDKFSDVFTGLSTAQTCVFWARSYFNDLLVKFREKRPAKSALTRGYENAFLSPGQNADQWTGGKKLAVGLSMSLLNPVLLLNFGVYSAIQSGVLLGIYNCLVGNIGRLSSFSLHTARQGFREKTVAGTVKGCLGSLGVLAVGALVYGAILCPVVSPVLALISWAVAKILHIGGLALAGAVASSSLLFSGVTATVLEKNLRTKAQLQDHRQAGVPAAVAA